MVHTLIDGNFIAHSTYSVFSKYGKVSSPLATARDQASFVTELTSKFFYAINQLPKGGQVVFVMDSRSWRKAYFEGYKSSREDKEGNKGTMDRESKEIFYKLIEDFCEMLKKVGIYVCRIQGAEGDDLLFHWSKYFNDRGDNVIIVTGDGDMKQCVSIPQTGDKEPWTITWTNKSNSNKLFVPAGWTDWLGQAKNSVFDFNLDNDQEIMSKLIRDQELKVEVVDINHYVFKKILIGDDGDDVPAVWTVYKGDDKSVRVTDKKADKIIEAMFNKPDSSTTLDELMYMWCNGESKEHLDSCLDEIAGIILRVMGDVDGKPERAKVVEALDRNAHLVWLRESMLPFNMNESIKDSIRDSVDTVVADKSKWNKKGLLEGSKYKGGSSVPRGFDPFSLLALPDEDPK